MRIAILSDTVIGETVASGHPAAGWITSHLREHILGWSR